MKYLLSLVFAVALLVAGIASAQTPGVGNGPGSIQAQPCGSGTVGAGVLCTGAGVPSSNCTKSALYIRTDGGVDTTIYYCSATNTWSSMPTTVPYPLSTGNGGTGAASLAAANIAKTNADNSFPSQTFTGPLIFTGTTAAGNSDVSIYSDAVSGNLYANIGSGKQLYFKANGSVISYVNNDGSYNFKGSQGKIVAFVAGSCAASITGTACTFPNGVTFPDTNYNCSLGDQGATPILVSYAKTSTTVITVYSASVTPTTSYVCAE